MEIYIDGRYYVKEEAKVSVFDHGLLYGDGIFEGLRVYNGKVFKLAEHMERLFMSAKAIMLDIPLSREEMMREVKETVRRNGTGDGYIRLIVTRGTGDLGIDPGNCSVATVIIIAGDIQIYPEKYYTRGIAVITSSLRKPAPDNFDQRIKSLNYLNNILARLEAKQAGCQEAVMLNRDGFVAECTVDNIFIIKNGMLLTPDIHSGLLEGITRETIIEITRGLGIVCREKSLTQYDLYTADEFFITGTGAEMLPVTKVDGRLVGDGKQGKITKEIILAFKKEIREMVNNE